MEIGFVIKLLEEGLIKKDEILSDTDKTHFSIRFIFIEGESYMCSLSRLTNTLILQNLITDIVSYK